MRSRTRRCSRSPGACARWPGSLLRVRSGKKPAIGVFGAGWVGLVTGACFAELGHEVIIRDIVQPRIEALSAGRVPFHETGLAELLERNRERLMFTLNAADLAATKLMFVCVGTPPTYSGDADLSSVWMVVDELPAPEERAILVMKSTVPVGTGEKVRAALDSRGLAHVGYVSNPEFLSEGTAVQDVLHPDRVVVGGFTEADTETVSALYDSIDAPVVRTDVPSAEMIKLAANAFLMTRISFINEIANVCEAVGADVVEVAKGVGLDHRLGPHFLRAGIGYGGSCLTGDETALVRLDGEVRLVQLERLYAELEDHAELEALAWDPKSGSAEFAAVTAMTRREVDGEIIELRTKMGRRIRCTPDHPWVTRDGVKLAEELTEQDWLPIAVSASAATMPHVWNLLEGLDTAGLEREDVIVRPAPLRLEALGAKRLQAGIDHRRGAVARSHDILRSGALRLNELDQTDLSLERAQLGGLGANCYEQRLPDSIWTAPAAYQRALLAGMWRNDGSWSFINGGPSVILEYGTVSRELADGVLRLLASLGLVASVRVGRVAKSTCDTFC